MRQQRLEDLALHRLVFRGGLDHDVAVPEAGVVGARVDPRQRLGLRRLVEQAPAQLPVHIAPDGGEAAFQRRLLHIDQPHIEAGKRGDMRDAAAHLPGADDAHRADAVVETPRHGGQSFSALYSVTAWVSSGTALNRSATSP